MGDRLVAELSGVGQDTGRTIADSGAKLTRSPIWDSFSTAMTVGVLPRRRHD